MEGLDLTITVEDVLREASELPEPEIASYRKTLAGNPDRYFTLGTYFERDEPLGSNFYLLAATDANKFCLVNIETGTRFGLPESGLVKIPGQSMLRVSESTLKSFLAQNSYTLYKDVWPIMKPDMKFGNAQNRRITQ